MNKDLDLICMSCFSPLLGNSVIAGSDPQSHAINAACPVCGYVEGMQTQPPHQLPMRTILNGKYLVGKALGEGGFGITYIGYDLNLDIRVAIKEYFPSGFASRTATVSETVTPHAGDTDGVFLAGRERFVGEAKRLAHFRNLPGIVMVSDFFAENGTAYIVMEYVEGQTLKAYLSEHGGTMPIDTVLQMLTPIFISLEQVHGGGIIHRDISPDNVMITPDGSVKLLDFGAAREFSESGNKSLSVLLKHGYAPTEQYSSKGKQGPHTDVYALAATIYRAITGVTPENAMDRILDDTMLPPSGYGVAITPQQEAALMKALEVRAQDRYQTMGEFFDALNPTASEDITMPLVGAASRRPQAAESRPYGKAGDIPNQQVASEPQTGGHKVRPYDMPVDTDQDRNDAVAAKPKNRKTAIIATTATVIVLVIVIIAVQVGNSYGRPGGGQQPNPIVVEIGNTSFTKAAFEYFYWWAFEDIKSTYQQQGLESMLPDKDALSESIYDSETGQTWSELLTERALYNMTEFSAVYTAAVSDNSFTVPQEVYDDVDAMILMQETNSQINQFPSLERYLQDTFGDSMTVDIYRDVLEFIYTSEDYLRHIRESFIYTDKQLDDYVAGNDNIPKDYDYRSAGMRQVLISRDNAQSEAADRAQFVYELFVAEGATEDALLRIMEDYSDDTTQGGLYENIAKINYQGVDISTLVVVHELESWLFADGRTVGDSALIETELYGYHLVYFTGYGEDLLRLIAEDMKRNDDVNEWISSLHRDEPVKQDGFIW